MHPIAIVMTTVGLGAAMTVAAVAGYLTYRALNENEPHTSNHSRSGNYCAFNSHSITTSVGECTICSRSIDIRNTTTLPCNHIFHKYCIQIWKRENVGLICPNCPLCTICRREITRFKKTLECNHVFHRKCIGRWLQYSKTCPLCKRSV